LGLNFGFSFRSESTAESLGTFEGELGTVAKCAVIARLRYEDLKRDLGLTDANVTQVLRIAPEKFCAWKARAETSDPDRSVTGQRSQMKL
jgi:hypothetical protein